MAILLQLSDLHFDEDGAPQRERIEAMRRQVDRVAPDLIVFTGDLVDRGPVAPETFEPARRLLESLGPPVRVVPGNHDVGNKVSLGDCPVTAPFLERWNQQFGADRFSRVLASWRVLGLNSQVTGSALAQEREQLSWLDEQLAEAERRQQPVAVFMHMPLFVSQPDEDLAGRPGYWQVDLEPRRQLLPRLQHPRVRLVASGHTHWHARFDDRCPPQIWCPALYSVVCEPGYPPGGDCTGMMRYHLDGDQITPQLIRL